MGWLEDLYLSLVKPQAPDVWGEQDQVTQQRLNNENDFGYNSVNPADTQIQSPSPEDQVAYATRRNVLGATTYEPPAPVSTDNSGGTAATGTDTGQVTNIESILANQRRIAQERANARLAQIQNALSQARGFRDEILGTLDERRGQFQTAFDEGNEDILQKFQQRMGEGQASMEGMQNRNRAALQAMGLSGSALLRAQGRETQAAAKALAQGQDQRSANRRQNRGIFDENKMWANQQEGAANRAFENAQNWAQSAQDDVSYALDQAGQNEMENVGSWVQSILDRQGTFDTSGLGNQRGIVDAYQSTPFTANLPDVTGFMNPTTGQVNAAQGGGGIQNVNINPLDQLIDPRNLNRRVGGSMYTGV